MTEPARPARRGAADAAATWSERPWAAVAIVATIFGAQALLRVLKPVTDQDSFWIAAAGRQAWATGAVPRENIFSFTDPHHAWVFHELAFGLAYAKGLSALGPAFLDLFGVLAGSATVVILGWHVAAAAKHRATFALVMLPALLELPVFHPRPPYASFGFVAGMTALAFGRRFGRRHALGAVALEWVWGQAHGSFPLGVVLLALGAAASERGRKLRLGAAGAAAVVTLLNPYGWRLHALVLQYAAGGSGVADVIHRHIEEFLPVWSAPTAFGPFDGIAVAVTAALGVWSIARGARLRGAIVLAASGLAMFQVRHVHLATILAAMLLVPEIDAAQRSPAHAPDATPSPARRALWAVLPGAVLALLVGGVAARVRSPDSMLGPNVGGAALPALLARVPDDAHVYAPFGVSPAVIWYGFPRGVRVMYDARNDCYSAEVALESLSLEYDETAQRKAAAVIAARGADHAFSRGTGAVFASLSSSSAWRLVDRRGDLALFERRPEGAMGGP
jgi:hypothetical protein